MTLSFLNGLPVDDVATTEAEGRVAFPVSVDGADNRTALRVMSQGEMQALGLATFLPRSCAPESP
ncbi:hypothetical protein [Micromonospora sp. NPDC005173]|uniref:hypothetical protein n=1 Tax=Micromonospora sp. NPDC005173 TaxID=3157165 RepID=UPI0033AFB76E